MTREELDRIKKDWENALHYTEGMNGEDLEALIDALEAALNALEKIYSYRSDKPDWNMIMAIAGDIVDPKEVVTS